MGTGVFFNLPAHGHINPTVPLVKELVKRGEKIVYFSTEEFKEKIKMTGAEFKAYHFDMPAGEKGLGTTGNFVRLAGLLLKATEKVMLRYIGYIDRLKPDYIIHDSMCTWGKYISRYMKIKAVNTTSTFVFTKQTLNKSDNFILKVLKMASEVGVAETFNTLKLKRKLSKKYGISGSIKDVFSNIENLNLIFTSRYFQPGGNAFGKDYQFLGPSISDRNDAPGFSFEKLDAKPLVYISLGTLANHNLKFYKRCIDALSDKEYNVLISIGDRTRIEDLGQVAPNIFIVNYVPQLEILKKTKLFISHAGMNSVSESLYFGVPLILYPHQPEQAMVAKRVEELGAGILMSEKDISRDLFNMVGSIIKNKAFYDNARMIGASFKESGGYVRGAQLILEYAMESEGFKN